ncbi:MAG: hypothetical protein EA375_01720, partial [Acholeplasmataceae bacterium]
MKAGNIIKTVNLKAGRQVIDLDGIYPIGSVKANHLTSVIYKVDDEVQASTYANRLEVELAKDDTLDVILGKGYVASRDEPLTERFLFDRGWSGGDGIFTFNLTNGRDAFDQMEPCTTLFVFGDTFVGTSDAKTKRRLQPHLMPNNSLAYMDKQGNLDFKLNWQADGSIGNFYNIDPAYDLTGTIAYNLVNYDRKEAHPGWLSGFHPKSIEIIFYLHKPRPVSKYTFENYFSDEMKHLNKRGIKSCQLW